MARTNPVVISPGAQVPIVGAPYSFTKDSSVFRFFLEDIPELQAKMLDQDLIYGKLPSA